ncbi:MAG: hypothetical protein KJZ92_14115 [Rhodocyclaceae bacterium]|nr:hypothetical protein [Rhodocyclaceae bacterium]
MGILYDMKAVFRWIEEATDKELADRQERLRSFLIKVETENVREEAKYLLKKVEEEILARTMR